MSIMECECYKENKKPSFSLYMLKKQLRPSNMKRYEYKMNFPFYPMLSCTSLVVLSVVLYVSGQHILHLLVNYQQTIH